MAHAIEGGKCKVWEKWPSGQPQAGGSEYLELHGVFSIALRTPGAALLSRFGFLAGRGAQEIVFAFQPIRGGVAGRNRPAEMGGGGPPGRDREETSSIKQTNLRRNYFLVVIRRRLANWGFVHNGIFDSSLSGKATLTHRNRIGQPISEMPTCKSYTFSSYSNGCL
jgi:hypothetical protein